MNLLLVDSVDFPFGGAHSVHVSLFMQGIRQNDENAFLLIPYGRKREALSASKKNYGHFDGIPYCFIRESKKMKKGFRFLDNFIGVIHTAALIYRRKKQKKLDAVILGGIVDILRDSPVIITCAIFRIPIYFWLVEKASLNEDYHGIPGYFNYKSQQLSERLLPKLAAGLIVISTSLKNYYRKYLPESKILINPILVSEQSHKSVNQQAYEVAKTKIEATLKNKRLLVYSGSFGEKDGIFYLIEAFAEVVKKYPDTVFVMTGKSETQAFKDKMQASIQQHNLQEKIILPGFVNSEELLCYNSMADILFVCRSNSPYANHGFPWKLGEYCMTGKPIIATRVSDIDNYFTDNEDLFIVAPNNPNAIAEKVNYIFSDYDTAMEVAKKGRAKALEVFGYTEKGKELVTFIKSNQKK
jgi:glycosyltransferase involved in cell wall biosynthesis